MNVNTLEAGSYTGINRRDTLFQMHNKTIELRIEQAYVELSMNGVLIARLACQNKERNDLTGEVQVEGDCCYFTLTDPKGARIRDHYLFNNYMNKAEFMYSDDHVVPQPVKPSATFSLNNVEYGLHVDNGFVEISKDGVSVQRLVCTNKECIFFTGKTHIYKDCFYFLLGGVERRSWNKLGIFNPQTNFFALSHGEIYNPHFANNRLVSVSSGSIYERYEDVIYTYELLQGPHFLKKLEHCITSSNGVPYKYVTLTEWEMQPF